MSVSTTAGKNLGLKKTFLGFLVS